MQTLDQCNQTNVTIDSDYSKTITGVSWIRTFRTLVSTYPNSYQQPNTYRRIKCNEILYDQIYNNRGAQVFQ